MGLRDDPRPRLVLLAISACEVSTLHPEGKALGVAGVERTSYFAEESSGEGRYRYGYLRFALSTRCFSDEVIRNSAMRLLLCWAFQDVALRGLDIEMLGLSAIEGSFLYIVCTEFVGMHPGNLIRWPDHLPEERPFEVYWELASSVWEQRELHMPTLGRLSVQPSNWGWVVLQPVNGINGNGVNGNGVNGNEVNGNEVNGNEVNGNGVNGGH